MTLKTAKKPWYCETKLLTISDYYHLVHILLEGHSFSEEKALRCFMCDQEAWANGCRAPFLPINWEELYPCYEGKCPRWVGRPSDP